MCVCKILLCYRLFFTFLTSVVILGQLLYICIAGRRNLLQCKAHRMWKCLMSTWKVWEYFTDRELCTVQLIGWWAQRDQSSFNFCSEQRSEFAASSPCGSDFPIANAMVVCLLCYGTPDKSQFVFSAAESPTANCAALPPLPGSPLAFPHFWIKRFLRSLGN